MATATRATSATDTKSLPEVTGYESDLRYYATRFKQGNRTVYAMDLSPSQIITLVAKPDPSVAAPGNRAIRPAHAQGFANYFREHENWVSPAMLLRAPSVFKFETFAEVEGTQFGTVSFARQAASDIHILDGQHRILGFHLADQNISLDLDKARSEKATARRVDPGGAAERQAEKKIDALIDQRQRLVTERVSLQIFIEDDPAAFKQMFFDIADNALGITASVKARFDARKVVNRALESVLEHPLLRERVDLEADRIGRGSPYIMGAKHVAEVIRSVVVGLEGRVSRRQDAEWSEQEVADKTKRFLDIAIDAFPPLKSVALGQILPDDLRKTSLLGSVLMIRILAGSYHELIENHSWTPEMVKNYFSALSPHMVGPVYEESIWMQHVPGEVFSEGTMAPHGRRQDLKALKVALVNWAVDREPFVTDAPAPRPAPASEEVDPEFGSGYTSVGADIPKS